MKGKWIDQAISSGQLIKLEDYWPGLLIGALVKHLGWDIYMRENEKTPRYCDIHVTGTWYFLGEEDLQAGY